MTARGASSSPASRPTGAGGSRRRSRDPSRSRRSSASTTRDPTRELERTEFVKVGDPARAAAADRRGGGDRHGHRHAPGRRLDDHLAAHGAREQRDRDDEHPRRLQRARTRPVRKFVFKSSAHYYGSEQDDPAFFTEAMGRPHPPRTPIERDIVEAEAAGQPSSPSSNPEVDGHGPALRERARARRRDRRTRAVLAARRADDPRLRPALPVRPRGRRRARAGARVAQRPARHLQRRRRRRARASARSSACSGKPSRRSCRRGAPGIAARRPAPARRAHPARDARPAALRPRGRQPRCKATGFDYGYTTREAVIKLARAPAPAADPARAPQEPYRYEREVEEFLRWSPHVRTRAPQGGRRAAELRAPSRRASGVRATASAAATRCPPAERCRRRSRPRRSLASRGAARAAPRAASAPAGAPVEHYDDLEAEEVITLLGSLEDADLGAARVRGRPRAPRVILAIDVALARRPAPVESTPGAALRVQTADAGNSSRSSSGRRSRSSRDASTSPSSSLPWLVPAPRRRAVGAVRLRLARRRQDRQGRDGRRRRRRRHDRRRGARHGRRSRLGRPAREAGRVTYGGQHFSSRAARTPASTPTSTAWSTQALGASHEGNIFSRAVRDADRRQGERDDHAADDLRPGARSTSFVRRVAEAASTSTPTNATIELGAGGARDGRRRKDGRRAATPTTLRSAGRSRARPHPTRRARSRRRSTHVKPKVTTTSSPRSTRRYIIVDRGKLPAHALQEPEARQDLHGRGRPARASRRPPASTHPEQAGEPVLARARTAPGPGASPAR